MDDEKPEILIRFGLALKKRRSELGLSQEELADKATLHRTYVGDIERGERNLSLVNIEKLAQALDIPVSALFANYVEKGQDE